MKLKQTSTPPPSVSPKRRIRKAARQLADAYIAQLDFRPTTTHTEDSKRNCPACVEGAPVEAKLSEAIWNYRKAIDNGT